MPKRLMTAMIRGTISLCLALILLPLCANTAPAQEADPQSLAQQTAPPASTAAPGIAQPIAEWDKTLTRITSELNQEIRNRGSVEHIRRELDTLRQEIDAFIAAQKPRLPGLEARLNSLGEAPKEGEPAEPEPVAQQRTHLMKEVGDLRGALRGANEASVRLNALSDRARARRRGLFERQILERDTTPLSPLLWQYIGRDLPIGYSRLSFIISNWWQALWSPLLLIVCLLGSIAIWAGLSFYARMRIVVLRRWEGEDAPTEWRRTSSAGRVILLRILPTAVATGFAYFSLSGAGLLSEPVEELLTAILGSLIIIATVQAAAKTALAVNRPLWRLVSLSHKPARRLHHHLMILAAVYGIDLIISRMLQISSMPFSVSIGQSFLSAIIIAGLIISILQIRQRRMGALGAAPIGPLYIRLPIWFVALFILGAALTGYVSLARFIAGQLIVTSTLLIIAHLLIISVTAFGQSLSEEETQAGQWTRDRLKLDTAGRERLALPIMLVLKALIIIAAVPFILLLWGFDWYDIGSWTGQALFGFEIGGVNVSIMSVAIALGLFAVGYLAAKFFQQWLDGYVLARAGVDSGVRDSVRTGVGYLGIGLASLLAVSYLGLDFSNLAIVAGALSVGVGFGLQSIVNNFVSGLILLAERPIRVGDWIIVGGFEGIVRKISVRSTEIETFDRANVVVPNSMLISDTVKNWTLHNSTGRMSIPIGVHYDSDPEQVRDVLLEIANVHPQVLSTPAPFVFFEDFGDSALNFVLYVYIANVNFSFSVRTDLRMAVVKEFRKHNIEIPYPQTDVHLRDLDWAKRAIRKDGGAEQDGATPKPKTYSAETEAPESDGDGGGE